jgi:hypothetical protein
MVLTLGFSHVISARETLGARETQGTRETQNTKEVLGAREAPDDSSSDTQEASKPASTYAGSQESIRLRRDLDEYSRTVDPAHVQIEERRRVMHLRLQQRFAETDRNNDGVISRIEAVELMPQVARHFNEVDTDADNSISLEELESLQNRIVSRQQQGSTLKVENIPDQADVIKHKNKDAMLSNHKRTL